ncbi:MAG: hypothetical protein H0W68_12570, partial [Gemmatimonadaceae bacterium]|nr:hypothetical protein [Gemmatimonadaceae bacterium]
FRAGLRDTTIFRFLKVLTPVDTTTDSLIVTGIVTNVLSLADTARLKIKLINGPTITIISPLPGDSANPGQNLRIRLSANHISGIVRLGFRIMGDGSFPTPLSDSAVKTFNPAARPGTIDTTFLIPANAPARSTISIVPFAVSADGQRTESSALLVPIRSTTTAGPAPLVRQTVSARSETTDSVTISASGNGIAALGFELRDASGVLVKTDTVRFAAPLFGTKDTVLSFKLPPTQQGQRLTLTSFAIDQAGVTGFSVAAGVTTPQTVRSLAFQDFTLIVFGQTFPLPAGRRGTVADVTVDQPRGNVFVSNLNFNLLEVFQNSAKAFAPNGIAVGAQPWGMTVARTGAKDTLFVANSGGTNLSRVYIGPVGPMKEDLSKRILTRVSFLYRVSEVRDPATQRIRITVSAPITFSDRPQYVEESSAGRLYVSTRPTTAAPKGTIRYLEPSAAAPDFRFILDFAATGSDPNSFLIANVDSIGVRPVTGTNTVGNDTLIICDHPTGTTAPSMCASSPNGIAAAVAALRAAVPTTDLEVRVNADENTLGLTDTTFAASSGNGNVIGFGEGNRAPFARTFLLKDSIPAPAALKYQYASPAISIADLVNNASDRLFGIALDSTGQTLGVHGAETFFAEIAEPFTLRLQGKVGTFGTGAGIAFHPRANGRNTPQDKRLAFVSSGNGTIEAVDIAFFFNRATLSTKTNLYGPLRASLPFIGDDPSIVLKLFGLSNGGLVVINLTANDIRSGP